MRVGLMSWLGFGVPNHQGVTPNPNPPASVGATDWNPGEVTEVYDPAPPVTQRDFSIQASPWDGWPAEWSTPEWGNRSGGSSGGSSYSAMGWSGDPRLRKLVDTAWLCLDRNSSILSSLPTYLLKSGKIVDPRPWLTNPDPLVYSSWNEFAKQLFWDYMLGEAFVLPMSWFADGYPATFRVIPPYMVNVDIKDGVRAYSIGSMDVSEDILHIRYQSDTTCARGMGPLDSAGARLTAAGVIQRYAQTIAEQGGTPPYVIEAARKLNKTEADDLLAQWAESRAKNAGLPAVISGGAKISPFVRQTAREMALIELSQFNESRIAALLGVPPELVALPGSDSMTYANFTSLFDFHDRSFLRPMASTLMAALSGWALPRGTLVEVNRDEYTRPGLLERAQAYKMLAEIGAISVEEIRAFERFTGKAPKGPITPTGAQDAATSLTGGTDA